MKTTLHVYDYDTNDRSTWPKLEGWSEPDAARFEAVLRQTPGRGHKMRALRMAGTEEPAAGEIHLETEHLFQNQWNSNKGNTA